MKVLRKLIVAGGAGAVAALAFLAGKAVKVAAAANPYNIVGGEVTLVNGGSSTLAGIAALAAIALGIIVATRMK